MRRIRVLHTLCRINSGGVEQRRLLLARGLPKDRYEHVVICQDVGGALPDLLHNEGWQIHAIGKARHILDPLWHYKAWKVSCSFKPDIIHGAVIEGVALANSIGLRLPRVPVISEETSDPVNRSWRGNLLMRLMCKRSSRVVGVSPAVGKYLMVNAKIPAKKVRVIDNAVSKIPLVSHDEIRAQQVQFGIMPCDIVVGSVGRLVDEHKRFSDLIRAIGILRRNGTSQIKLMLIGDGPDLTHLKKLVNDQGLDSHVIFAGYRSDVRRLYPLMDIFALASAHEAFGLVLVEAMLARLPIVATRVGGIPYILENGKAGRLVQPFDPMSMANEIGLLVNDAQMRKNLGSLGQSRAETKFSDARYCTQVHQLYQSLFNA